MAIRSIRLDRAGLNLSINVGNRDWGSRVIAKIVRRAIVKAGVDPTSHLQIASINTVWMRGFTTAV